MKEKDLIWEIKSKIDLLHTPVFSVVEQDEVSATGLRGGYVAMEAPDWAMAVAEYEGNFVLVRQWRHASGKMSLEFPGGVVDKEETPAQAAARELLEETGFKAGKITHLGSVSPNPALFKNRFHAFLAEELEPTGEQKLDEDELLTYELMPIKKVIESYGEEPFDHALMGTALAFYIRKKFL